MKKAYLPIKAKTLLNEFDNAFQNAWDIAQEILYYIEDVYDGDKNEFMSNALHNVDYCTVAKALKAIFDFSEN